jgi:uncharacterized membrane protein (UPF0182 family)
MTEVPQQRARRWPAILLAGGFAILALSTAVATFYTDVLWFQDLGHADVFWVTLGSRWAVGLTFGALFFAMAYINVVIARRMAPNAFLTVAGQIPPQLEQGIIQLKQAVEPMMRWLLPGVCMVLAVISGSTASADWRLYRLAMDAVSTGRVDPQFGRDISFYLFSLPALRAASDWLFGALVAVLVVTALVHVLDGAIKPWERLRGFAPHVKAHLSVLIGLIVGSRALDYWLRIFELGLSERGQVLGASFTDVNAQLPAYRILIVIALISALILIVNIRSQGWRLPAIALGVWVGAAVLVGGVYPALVQSLQVAPNEIAAEAPYIARNITATRQAFGLDEVELKPFAANTDLTSADVVKDRVTIENARLWDPNVIKSTYKQLQEIRPYYDFMDVDIDRYSIDGTRTEVLIAPREMNVSKLAEQAKTWVNEHLSYTHGFGVVVSPVNDVGPQGSPLFAVKNIPPTTVTDLKITQPRVYYGEGTTNYVVAGSSLGEFDYPMGSENATTSYSGKTGVPVGGLLRRLAFAVRFGSTDLLLSAYVKPDSKVLYFRSIRDRMSLLAPWLLLDGDPYVAIMDGRIVWILDGYTTSDMYPYSQRTSGVNYIRNSVKATIDAYDGTVHLYAFDEKDPILATWRRIYPGLVEDSSAMPASVRAHLRYPEDMFLLQAEVFATYHMLDPRVFYNKEDQWAFPLQSTGDEMKPFYVLMRLPGETTEDFVLMMPFTPRGKQNMIGWIAAKSDPADYGRRVAFEFPKQKLVLGPEQIHARINQEPAFSSQLSLWNQRGSQVVYGNLLVLPVKDSIVYIQPLYLQGEQTAIPQLIRVVVAYGDRIAMEADLATALGKAFGFSKPAPVQTGGPSVETTATQPGGTAESGLAKARDLYRKAIDAQRAGDWAGYGRAIEELGRVLESIATSSAVATGSPRP